MIVSYGLFRDAFLGKVAEYDFLKLGQYDRDSIIYGYMYRACAQFNKICKYDLLARDDVVLEFKDDFAEEDVDEIVDIISEGMLVQWMKPYVYRADNLENILNTPDFSSYSPAELLYRITSAYKEAKKDFTNMMREYSYNHGDLSDLHL